MKLVGFIKKHDDHDFSKSLNDYLLDGYETPNRNEILEFLKKGQLCLAWMEWIFDDDENDTSIGPNGYYTDGEWVWPNYLSYYLLKHSNFKIEQSFIDYVLENQDESVDLTEEQISKIEKKLFVLTESSADPDSSN